MYTELKLGQVKETIYWTPTKKMAPLENQIKQNGSERKIKMEKKMRGPFFYVGLVSNQLPSSFTLWTTDSKRRTIYFLVLT